MKKNLILLTLILLSCASFSQNSMNYLRRFSPTFERNDIQNAQFVRDIMPNLWEKMYIPPTNRKELDQRIKYALTYYLFPQTGYNTIIEFISVDLTATVNQTLLSSRSSNDQLTLEQKELLATADLGSNISIKMRFKYIPQDNDQQTSCCQEIIEGEAIVTVVPAIEAEYPGGPEQFTQYINKHVLDKTRASNAQVAIQRAVVNFTVNESGEVVHVKLKNTSSDAKVDQIILDAAAKKMPAWKPAENMNNIKVKQEFTIAFGGC